MSYFRSYPEGLNEAIRDISLALEAPIISSFSGITIGSVPNIVQTLYNELVGIMIEKYNQSFACGLESCDGYDADDEWPDFSGEDS